MQNYTQNIRIRIGPGLWANKLQRVPLDSLTGIDGLHMTPRFGDALGLLAGLGLVLARRLADAMGW